MSNKLIVGKPTQITLLLRRIARVRLHRQSMRHIQLYVLWVTSGFRHNLKNRKPFKYLPKDIES